MNQLNTFTSTGLKLIKHIIEDPELLKHPRPISLQVALTEKCNLNCSFCSVSKRARTYEFDYDELCAAVIKFVSLGTKTVEITGGGEPLLYPRVREFINFCSQLGLQLGLITNGTLLNKLSVEELNFFSWIRISMNVLDYIPSVYIPTKSEYRGTLGFSYCFGADSTEETLTNVVELAKKFEAEYVRVVPNCLATDGELIEAHKMISRIVDKLGPPAFYQQSVMGHPAKCKWGYFKPFLYCDGFVFPCSSIVLNPDASQSFSEKYRLCHWSSIDDIYRSFDSVIDTMECTRCVCAGQNDLIAFLMEPNQHQDFI